MVQHSNFAGFQKNNIQGQLGVQEGGKRRRGSKASKAGAKGSKTAKKTSRKGSRKGSRRSRK